MSTKHSNKIKIGIIGLGMVGEPIKKWFEEYHKYRRGKELFCYDTDPKKGYSDDINKADVVFVAVPTPSNPDGGCNTSIVQNAVATVKDGKIVVIKSTVPPGTVEGLQKKYPRKRFVFNPEFLTESQSWIDYIKPDRQILAHTARSYGDIREIMAVLPKAHFERPWASDYTKKDINVTEAELAKYASNVFGYIKVIYGNILADLCHALEIIQNKQGIVDGVYPVKSAKGGAALRQFNRVNYENVREVISADPRVGPAWLNVEHGNYCGAGGYCFPKDMDALISFAESLVDDLSKIKGKTDPGLIASVKKGIGVLKAIADYNKTLLGWQSLTIEDVSMHDKEIVVQKRKPIRVLNKSK